MTKREMFENIATINADNAEIVAFCEREIELLNRKKTSKKGITAVQKANVAIKETLADILANADAPMTVTEILGDSRMEGYTNQKISALLRQMVEANTVMKTIEGKKARFSTVA